MNDPYLTDDFHPLHLASSAILSALRDDESSPHGDLYKRLVSGGTSRYFEGVNNGEGSLAKPSDLRDTNNAKKEEAAAAVSPTSSLLYSHSIPLPPPIAHAVQNAKIASFMGLASQASLVWVACDGELFLWRYGSSSSSSSNDSAGGYESDYAAGGGNSWGGVPSLPRQMSGDVCSFRVPSGQCVMGVGVVRPKKGVFKPSVKWCIAISTPSELILCALQTTQDNLLRLIPTRFILPTDNIPMISIQGTQDGRIYMGGYDGCLYEMSYEGQQKTGVYTPHDIEEAIDDYFDGSGELVLDNTKRVDGVVSGGKRVFSALTFEGEERRRKCRKINHSSIAGGMSAVVPGVVVRAAASMFGSSTEAASRKGGPIVSLVLDEERMCLYTLGANGIICTYDMVDAWKKNANSPPRLACVMDSVATAKLYLDSVSRGRMYPPVTTQSIQLGTITFPGGMNSAQAGVGGMEGAREILKRHDREVRLGNPSGASSKLNPREMTNSAGILHPVSIHLVKGIESKSLTLVAITGGGLRYYLSSLTSSSITSAQASQGSFGYTSLGNDSKLARVRPGKKMTFCHIRAPPPYISTDGSNGGLKIEVAPSTTNMLRAGSGSGIPPGIHNNPIPAGADGKKGDVVKSYYDKDIFVLALDVEKGNKSTRSDSEDFFSQASGEKKKTVEGNALIITLPDSAARLVENANSTTTSTAITVYNGSSNDSARSTSGGVSEICILPMSGTGEINSAVLPGGTTFDVSSQNNRQSALASLFTNSETPTDSELHVGLIPSFTPPKIRARRINPTPGATSAIAAPYNGQGRGVISSALSTLSNFLRSGQGYGYQVTTASGSSGGLLPAATFRVSRRRGCDVNGFSNSSAEVPTRPGLRSSTPQSTIPKSARLPSWLMAPSAAPMSFQTSLHLNPPGSDSVLVLNAGGLHFFTNSSLLNNLASVLLRASNVAKDESLRNFFTSYGYAEGCAMCFALATSISSNSNLRSKAEQAALTHALNPSYTLIGTGDGRDPLSAYQFKPSALYDGLVKFSSRLLRPFWHKPAVVVTEGKPIQSKYSLYSSYYAAVPAKVELLLDEVTLDEIRRPLILLQDMMKKTFVPVVQSVPGGGKSRADSMDIDDDINSGGLYTRALLNQSRAAQRNSNQPHDLTADELRKCAFYQEDRNMHSLYRLWSRCIQMLNLMTILEHAHSSPALPAVQWGLIHGLSYQQLVTTYDGQQRIEAILNGLFSQSENKLISDLSIEDSQFAELLSRKCYLYFSAASRLTYLGFKAARDALSKSAYSDSRKALSQKSASYLRAAARHWHDPSLVVGKLAASSNWQDVAMSAIDNGSVLALAAEELMKLGNAEGVADICLISASNFGGAKVQRDVSKELGEAPIEGMFDWEKGLYQQPPVEKVNATTPSSSTQIVVSGIKANSSDALRACHSILFYYISKLLGQGGEVNQRLAVDLLSVCASSSDVKFLRLLYDHLVATNNIDTLLRIDSSTLENWLKEKNDADLLFKYYSFHGRNVMAGDVMRKMALDTVEKVSIAQRIECLTRAAGAFSAAICTPAANEQVSLPDLNGRITQLTEQLDVAAIQQRILTIAQQSKNTNLDQEKMNALSFSLVNVSDLYNEYAAPLNLFDLCLEIMMMCRQNNPAHINTLWKSIICEEILPCGTNSRVAYDYLNDMKVDSMIEEDIVFGQNLDDNIKQFDNGSWIPRLKATITELGKNLYGKGADCTFPVDFLLETLEGLRQVQSAETPSPWPVQIMLDVGVPYYSIMATYEGFRVHNRGIVGENGTALQYFVWMADLLDIWTSNAQSNSEFSSSGNENSASMQLTRAINQDRLLDHIDSLKLALEDLSQVDANSIEHVYSRLTNVRESIRRIFL